MESNNKKRTMNNVLCMFFENETNLELLYIFFAFRMFFVHKMQLSML